MSDLELAQSIANGSPDAMSALVSDHYGSVMRFMIHLTRHAEDAEDLTHQTFLEARRSARQFQGRSSLKTWVHRIAFHEYTRWRRQQKRLAPMSAELSWVDPGFEASLDAICLLDALHRIPEPYRSAFLLHEVQELSVQETAKVLGRPVGTIKSRLNKARHLLRQQLGCGLEEYHNDQQANDQQAYESL